MANSGTTNVPHVVLAVGYDHLGDETSLSVTIAGTADLLNNYTYDSDGELTQVTQQGQTGGNTVTPEISSTSPTTPTGSTPRSADTRISPPRSLSPPVPTATTPTAKSPACRTTRALRTSTPTRGPTTTRAA